MIDKVLSRSEFIDQPPVLIDIGASGSLPKVWRKIARYSVCLAFDADARDFSHATQQASRYRSLHVIPALVADFSAKEVPFYLTRSPHCSSLLPPDLAGLAGTYYADKFVVERVRYLPTLSLESCLAEHKLNYVDWFKCDSQGTDLRLFKALGKPIIEKVLVAEFEPGIIQAYKGEDNVAEVLAFMRSQGIFWLANCEVKGSIKMEKKAMEAIFKTPFWQKIAMFSHKKMAGWAELAYMHELPATQQYSLRDYLLAWVFAIILEQYGFALYITTQIQTYYPHEAMTMALIKYAQKQVRLNVWKGKFAYLLPLKIRQWIGK